MATLTRWTWVWVNSGSWWWTGRPGVLQFMGSQRVGHDCATDLIWSDLMFHQIWDLFSHYFFKYFFLTLRSSPFVTPLMHMLVHLIVSHRSLKLCSFFFILFSFPLFRLNYFIFPRSSLILSSAWSYLLLKFSIEIFMSVSVLFSSRILICISL